MINSVSTPVFFLYNEEFSMKRILLVDDSKEVLSTYKAMLEIEGYTVDTALNGALNYETSNHSLFKLNQKLLTLVSFFS